jgi:hypothetical protein
MLSAKYPSTQISATEKYWSMEKGKQGKYGANDTYIGVCKYWHRNMYVHILTLTESVLHCSICLNIITGLMRKIL